MPTLRPPGAPDRPIRSRQWARRCGAGYRRRDIVERGAEGERQAEQGAMQVERRQARAAKGSQRLVEAADILQRQAEIEMAGGEIRHQGDGLAAGGLGRLRAAARAQRMAEVAVGLDIVGLELQSLLETPRGFLEPLQL